MLCQLPKQREKGMRTYFGWKREHSSQSVRGVSDGFDTANSEWLNRFQPAWETMSGGEVLTTSLSSDLPPCLYELIETWIRNSEHPSL
jgi:hypothetical protein